jgi:hypothetical protein
MEEATILELHLLSALQGEQAPDSPAWSEASPTRESLLWAFSFEQNLSGSPEDAPSLVRPLRGPKLLSRLDPGNYYFLQWREGSYETIEDGMEDFLRQLWWEGKTCKGPLILRVLNEEGRRTFQVLRSLA